MKNIILFLAFIISLPLFGQPVSGSKLKANFPVQKDINGNTVDVEAWLKQGKMVVIDVFATWCAPCWDDYNSKLLQNLYTKYGPAGTDKIKLVSIEGDLNTTVDHIKGIGTNTKGNWTKNVTYPIVNDDGKVASFLSISYFPTLIVIRPDRTLLNIEYSLDNRALALDFAVKSTRDYEIGQFNIHNSVTFCHEIDINETFTFINIGAKPITSAKFDVVKNGKVVKTFEVKKQIGVYEYFDVVVDGLTTDINSSFYLNNTSINNVAVPLELNRSFFIYQKTNIVHPKFKIAFTTDNFPGETSWELKDENNKIIASKKYSAGPGAGGSGGADASKVHEHWVELKNTNYGCLTFEVKDAGNNGMLSNSGTLRSGLEIYDNNNVLIKAKLRNEFVFTSSYTDYLNASMITATTSLSDVPITISPNPAYDYLTLDVPKDAGQVKYAIFSADGRCIIPFELATPSIDINTLQNGLYLMHIQANDQPIKIMKFVKI